MEEEDGASEVSYRAAPETVSMVNMTQETDDISLGRGSSIATSGYISDIAGTSSSLSRNDIKSGGVASQSDIPEEEPVYWTLYPGEDPQPLESHTENRE